MIPVAEAVSETNRLLMAQVVEMFKVGLPISIPWSNVDRAFPTNRHTGVAEWQSGSRIFGRTNGQSFKKRRASIALPSDVHAPCDIADQNLKWPE